MRTDVKTMLSDQYLFYKIHGLYYFEDFKIRESDFRFFLNKILLLQDLHFTRQLPVMMFSLGLRGKTLPQTTRELWYSFILISMFLLVLYSI